MSRLCTLQANAIVGVVCMQVYKALQNGVRIVAIKLSDTGEGRGKHVPAFWREIELIANCRDRNILQFYGAAVNGVRAIIVCHC